MKKFEKLMVLNVVLGSKDAVLHVITLPVPADQRDDFAAAVAGAQLLVTRKVAPN